METLSKEEVNGQVKEAIKRGAVFIHPTDTIYGLGCNALLNNSVKKIRQIKERYTRPFSVIAPSKKWIYDNCEINEEVEEWIDKLPGPYTLILKLKNKQCISSFVNTSMDTLGVRIPDHWFSKIVEEVGYPVVTTSANLVNQNFMTSLDDLDSKIQSRVDFIIYEGEKKGKPSRLIDLSRELQIIER